MCCAILGKKNPVHFWHEKLMLASFYSYNLRGSVEITYSAVSGLELPLEPNGDKRWEDTATKKPPARKNIFEIPPIMVVMFEYKCWLRWQAMLLLLLHVALNVQKSWVIARVSLVETERGQGSSDKEGSNQKPPWSAWGSAGRQPTELANEKPQLARFGSLCAHLILQLYYPKDPAVLKIVRVVNILRGLNLLSRCDLLSRRTLCGRHFLGITGIFPLKEGSEA